MKTLVLTLLSLATFASAVDAQLLTTSLTGRVRAVGSAGGSCNPNATHFIECSSVQLTSSTVDLTQFEGQIVDLSGSLSIAPNCVTLDVAEAAGAASRTTALALFGYRPGRTFVYTTLAPVGSFVITAFSGGEGFLPLGPFGTLLIDPFTTALPPFTDISIGLVVRRETIPNDPSLSGVEIHYQAAYVSVLAGLDVKVLNPNCFTIQ